MRREEMIMVGFCDYAGKVQAKGFAAADWGARRHQGIGLAKTNLMINALGQIAASPWGPRGDLVVIPDPDTRIRLTFDPDDPVEHTFLGDVRNTDNTPWAGCPRSFLRSALADLETEAGLRVLSAFEHEFHYSGAESRIGDAYALESVRSTGVFVEALFAALRAGNVEPDTFLPEYGPQQFELTHKPALGLAAADRAVRLREITRLVARRLGHRACFSPVVTRNFVGNGLHIHFSLIDERGQPAGYDAERPHGISAVAGAFVAGALRQLPALCAFTAPSVISYERLRPNSWSAAYNNLGRRDREAAIRLCPVFEEAGIATERQYHFELRACDGASNPYFALGALVRAGLQGIRDGLATPEPTLEGPEALSEPERARRGITRLPQSLDEALIALESDAIANAWFTPEILGAYVMLKHGEIEGLRECDADEICERYRQAY